MLLSIWKGTEQENRRYPSTFKNMPFLHVEEPFLDARKAYSIIQLVMCWFLAGYKLCFEKCLTALWRELGWLCCKYISLFKWLFWCVDWNVYHITWKEEWVSGRFQYNRCGWLAYLAQRSGANAVKYWLSNNLLLWLMQSFVI